jgi:hypothetical protein
MNEDLANLAEWLNFNKHKLNVDKTKYMIITKITLNGRKQHQPQAYKSPVKSSSARKNMKYLGVTIDLKLTFKDHLANITKKSRAELVFWIDFSKN